MAKQKKIKAWAIVENPPKSSFLIPKIEREMPDCYTTLFPCAIFRTKELAKNVMDCVKKSKETNKRVKSGEIKVKIAKVEIKLLD